MAHATQNKDEVLDNSTILLDLVNLFTENEVFISSIMNELAVKIIEKADGYSQTSPIKLSDVTNINRKRSRDENFDEDDYEDEDEERASSSSDKAKTRYIFF
jgi:hypothetical protein